MDRKEKVELILEQMRLCLATKDYIRTQIISKKISIKFFENSDNQQLKLKFYEYMIEMDQHEGTYLNVCRHYRAIYDTPCIQEDSAKKLMVLCHVALYVVLSQYDNEQSDLINRILKEKALEDIPLYKSFLELFTNMELINQDGLCQMYEKDLRYFEIVQCYSLVIKECFRKQEGKFGMSSDWRF
jgi:26S proteasome regulatory subunit N5